MLIKKMQHSVSQNKKSITGVWNASVSVNIVNINKYCVWNRHEHSKGMLRLSLINLTLRTNSLYSLKCVEDYLHQVWVMTSIRLERTLHDTLMMQNTSALTMSHIHETCKHNTNQRNKYLFSNSNCLKYQVEHTLTPDIKISLFIKNLHRHHKAALFETIILHVLVMCPIIYSSNKPPVLLWPIKRQPREEYI